MVPTAAVNANTRQSIDRSSATVLVRVDSIATSARLPQAATSNPAAAPIIESIRLSTMVCPISCPRLAPSDSITASSLRRAADCASSRLAMFPQAMAMTRPTMPRSTNSAWL